MTNYIEPPPPQPLGMGCLGKGCLILSLFILFLIIACAVGLYVGMKTNSAFVHGIYWAEKAHMLATEPSLIPQFETTQENIEATARKWRDFDRASHEDQPARLDLTAGDLNNLIARNRHLRGKAFVTIENNLLHVQASLPLGEYFRGQGYYLNGDIVIRTDGPSSLEHPPLSRITINGEPLPQDLLNWKFRSRRFSDYSARYKDKLNASTFEIRDGKVILSKNGR